MWVSPWERMASWLHPFQQNERPMGTGGKQVPSPEHILSSSAWMNPFLGEINPGMRKANELKRRRYEGLEGESK